MGKGNIAVTLQLNIEKQTCGFKAVLKWMSFSHTV